MTGVTTDTMRMPEHSPSSPQLRHGLKQRADGRDARMERKRYRTTAPSCAPCFFSYLRAGVAWVSLSRARGSARLVSCGGGGRTAWRGASGAPRQSWWLRPDRPVPPVPLAFACARCIPYNKERRRVDGEIMHFLRGGGGPAARGAAMGAARWDTANQPDHGINATSQRPTNGTRVR
jgi:hypothetical protein